MDTVLQDVRFGLRLLRRSPGFTTAAVLALGLGIGATTAVFTLLDRVVLRPLPYPHADRLLTVWETNDAGGRAHERISPVNFGDYRALSHVFEDAAAWWYPQLNLTQPERDPMRVNAVETSANFFSVIGVQPVLGAGFPAAPLWTQEPAVVISDRLWRQRFGADAAIVGTLVTLNGQPFTVAGVMPAGFHYPADTDVWQRLTWPMERHSRGAHFMESLFRLKPGVTVDAANAELRALTTRLGRENAATNRGWGARAVPLAREIAGDFRPALFALFGAAACLLVITCTNVAGLLLARATVREREVAVRAAIGAGRGRLIRQFLTESVMLAAGGTMLGIAAAAAGVRAMILLSPVDVPRLDSTAPLIDARALLFASGIAAATAVAFGLVPALFMARGDVQGSLRDAGRSADGGGRRSVRGLLVVGEVALAVMLLVGAALLSRAFQHLAAQDPGFHPSRTVAVSLELPYSYRDFRKISDFFAQLLTTIRSQPGVSVAGASTFLPLDAGWRLPFFVGGRPRPAPNDLPVAQTHVIDEDYFKAIGTPLVAGRFFEARDTVDAPGVVLINRAMARLAWPSAEPIGQTITMAVGGRTLNIGPMGLLLLKPTTAFQIVGVVGDVKNQALNSAAEPAIYFTFRQFSFRELHLVVQGRAEAAQLVAAVRSSVQQLDPELPLAEARTLQQIVDEATDRPRALMLLMGAFAAIALLLAALGIYSVLAYGVSQRRQELSVRIALGARRRDVAWLVVRQGLWLSVIGAAAGVAGALALGRTLAGLLYGISPVDGRAYAVAIGVVFVSSLAACWLPARRAAVLDPSDGLRAQ